MGQEGRELRVRCVSERVWSSGVCSGVAAAVALGVFGLGVEISAEIDAQLFVVLSALTDSESFDVVMSAHGFESKRKLV